MLGGREHVVPFSAYARGGDAVIRVFGGFVWGRRGASPPSACLHHPPSSLLA